MQDNRVYSHADFRWVLEHSSIGFNDRREKIVKSILLNSKIMLLKGITPGVYGDHQSAEIEPLDLPFESVWFEFFDDNNDIINLRPIDTNEFPVDTYICGFFVTETGFNEYIFTVIVAPKNREEQFGIVSYMAGPGPDPEGYVFFKVLARNILKRINEPTFVTGAVTLNKKERVSISPSGKLRTGYVSRNVIIVAPKKEIPTLSIPGAKTPIDFSQRWEVRGHWRKTDTIGKNREDEYVVEGYTWVKAHVKGPEEAPLVIKKRLFIGEEKNIST